MKKIISFLLLISLLIVPLSSCELLDSILPDAPDETTTPNATTPADTIPNNPDNNTPSDSTDPTTPDATTPTDTPDATTPTDTPDATTPTDTPDVTPPTDATERNLVTELFGDETVEFDAPVFTMSGALSDASPLRFKIENGKINLLFIGNTYNVSYVENVTLTYPEDDMLWWGVEKDENALEIYDEIKNATGFYVLEAEGEVLGYQKIELYIIDGVHYFLTHNSNPTKVLRIHYAVLRY